MNKQDFYELTRKIVETINKLSLGDGVKARVIVPEPYGIHTASKIFILDIELIFNGYRIVERFNQDMTFDWPDVDKIAVALLRDLFHDYFQAKSLLVVD
jgi:hypothetical protein